MSSAKPNWKKIIELVIAILSVIGSFLGGQALAQNGHVDIFNKYEQNQSINN